MIKNRRKLGQPKQGEKRLVFGDVHGQYDAVMALLESSKFDPSRDSVVFVGDLIDRGPDSLKCAKLLKQPYVHCCVGNHELLALDAYTSLSAELIKSWHLNGGSWFFTLDSMQQNEVIQLFLTRLYWTIEFNWDQYTIGVVHSEIPPMANWGDFDNGFPIESSVQKYLVWSRQRVFTQSQDNVSGIDFTISGHTITGDLLQLGNTLSIDTGAALMNREHNYRGKLSVLVFSDEITLKSIYSNGDIETQRIDFS